MPIDPSCLWRQIELGEDSELELKAVAFRGRRVSAPGRDALADELAAFGNAGGGRVVLGVTDERQPQSLAAEQIDELVRLVGDVCSDSIKPSLEFRIYRVPDPSGGGVLVVEIPESVTVHRSPGGYMRRRGESRRQMDSAEIRRLSQARGQSEARSTDTQVVGGTGINTLRQNLWRRYAGTHASDSDQVTLSKLKFVKDDSHGTPRATVGGVLLATQNPQEWMANAWVQAVSYRGIRPDTRQQVDARAITGPLDEQIREAVRFVVRNRRVAAYKDPARADVPQFSDRAVFEAVVNSVVHRDYAVSGSRIRLFMFDDRLELYSPGGLCNSMTVDDLRLSQFTRNELIASRLAQCAVGDVPGTGERRYFIERRGEGIGVIEDETYALAGRPAIFELVGERELRVILPAACPPPLDGVMASVAVTDRDTGVPLAGVDVLMIHPNRTYREGRTDSLGHAAFELHSELPMTVFLAAKGFRAHVVHNHQPASPLEVHMQPVADGGSQIIADRSGHLQGIQGRLHPILDRHDRTYLHANDISINSGQTQPVHFTLDDELHLTDSLGASARIRFREMIGNSCIFDYRYEQG